MKKKKKSDFCLEFNELIFSLVCVLFKCTLVEITFLSSPQFEFRKRNQNYQGNYAEFLIINYQTFKEFFIIILRKFKYEYKNNSSHPFHGMLIGVDQLSFINTLNDCNLNDH